MKETEQEDKIRKLFLTLSESLDHYTYVEIVDLMLEVNLGHPYFGEMSKYIEPEKKNINENYLKNKNRERILKVIKGGKNA